jgi:hypothetical protein
MRTESSRPSAGSPTRKRLVLAISTYVIVLFVTPTLLMVYMSRYEGHPHQDVKVILTNLTSRNIAYEVCAGGATSANLIPPGRSESEAIPSYQGDSPSKLIIRAGPGKNSLNSTWSVAVRDRPGRTPSPQQFSICFEADGSLRARDSSGVDLGPPVRLEGAAKS